MTRGKTFRLLLTCLAVGLCCLTLVVTTAQTHAQTVSRNVQASSQAQQSVTPQINRTDCDGRTDFLRIWSGSFLDCFANSGFLDVNILYVYKVCSGNNSGTVYYGYVNGEQYFTDFTPGMCWSVPIVSWASNSITSIYIDY